MVHVLTAQYPFYRNNVLPVRRSEGALTWADINAHQSIPPVLARDARRVAQEGQLPHSDFNGALSTFFTT
jgi:hypothetical protein